MSTYVAPIPTPTILSPISHKERSIEQLSYGHESPPQTRFRSITPDISGNVGSEHERESQFTETGSHWTVSVQYSQADIEKRSQLGVMSLQNSRLPSPRPSPGPDMFLAGGSERDEDEMVRTPKLVEMDATESPQTFFANRQPQTLHQTSSPFRSTTMRTGTRTIGSTTLSPIRTEDIALKSHLLYHQNHNPYLRFNSPIGRKLAEACEERHLLSSIDPNRTSNTQFQSSLRSPIRNGWRMTGTPQRLHQTNQNSTFVEYSQMNSGSHGGSGDPSFERSGTRAFGNMGTEREGDDHGSDDVNSVQHRNTMHLLSMLTTTARSGSISDLSTSKESSDSKTKVGDAPETLRSSREDENMPETVEIDDQDSLHSKSSISSPTEDRQEISTPSKRLYCGTRTTPTRSAPETYSSPIRTSGQVKNKLSEDSDEDSIKDPESGEYQSESSEPHSDGIVPIQKEMDDDEFLSTLSPIHRGTAYVNRQPSPKKQELVERKDKLETVEIERETIHLLRGDEHSYGEKNERHGRKRLESGETKQERNNQKKNRKQDNKREEIGEEKSDSESVVVEEVTGSVVESPFRAEMVLGDDSSEDGISE
ncbi:hypothetical protein BLNAU_18447 [Blattamonas nauphoetae]|uniref:Uncharacterized protein n=1 Tax=Blattamonas nauphoetae TaxID=2049346 RepID=A0ABQ9X4A9_9EUKA|nr:hypothetical protein BLNAU_18447 [Blattamonas nauphoetae]